jgi:hypothetical protein
MKGLYWNGRGLSDLAKHRYITEAIKESNPDFVAIMESGKQDMQQSNLSRLSGGADFIWHCLPPRGRSGGILLGVNGFFIKFHLCNKSNNFKWILMAGVWAGSG